MIRRITIEQSTPFAPHRGIEDVAGGDLTVGFFEDGTFIIANQDYAAPVDVTITTTAGLELLDLDTDTFVPVENGKVSIPAGEGAYLRILA